MNEITLYGSVGASWWDEDYFTSATVRDLLAGMTGDLTVRINSGGGIATEGQAIYTMLKDHPGQVHVVIDGVAASAASLIAMAGDTITMRLGAWMLVHDPAQGYTEGRGTEADHLRAATQLRVISNAYADVYAARTGLTRDEVRAIMRDETVMDSEMAISLGFASASDTEAASPAAMFDYRLYANAPAELRKASECLGKMPGKAAIAAMLTGLPGETPQPKMEVEMTEKPVDVAAEETSVTETEVQIEVAPETPEAPKPTARNETMRERNRVRAIIDATEMAGLPSEFGRDLIDRGVTEAVALDAILKQRKDTVDMNDPIQRGPAAVVTADARDKFKQGAELALMAKVGMAGERNEFSSLSLAELARESIALAGETATFSDRRDLVGRAFTMAGANSTSDFANILSNVMGKAALMGWEEADETYQIWTRAGTLTDFKATKRVGAGLFDALPAVAEGADYTFGTVGDRGESITLATYGKMLRITRQAIINDDLSILGMLPRRMGRAARRTVGNLVYAVLTGNPAMSDGTVLFHTNHKNLAGSAAAPSVDSLGKAKAAMRIQKEKTGGPSLNIAPRYMIVPAALEVASSQLLGSSVDPTATKGHASNPVAGMAELIVDGRLDDASATAWYLAADPNAYDTIEVAYLDGNDAPYLEQQGMWTSDGVEMKVRIDAGVAPLDFRTLYKNAGS